MKKKIKFILIPALILSIILGSFFLYKQKYASQKKSAEKNYIDSLYYSFSIDRLRFKFSKYGAIENYKDKIIYVSGDSEFFLIDTQKNKEKTYEVLQLKIPIIDNKKDKFVKNNFNELGEDARLFFNIKDVFVGTFNDPKNQFIIISSLKYLEEKNCYNLSLYKAKIIESNNLNIKEWDNFFSTQPCLDINLTENPKFAAASAGGRIFKLDEENILLTVGDFFADGVNGPILSQDAKNDYGKILKINIENKDYSIYSYGHRNPQGLYVDSKKNIFASEHGPDRGDELNLILENKNYGWPIATFGVNYGSKKWSLDKTNGSHDNFEKPIYSWGNQFAASSIFVYNNKYLQKWKDNILVSSLGTKKISRITFNKKKKSVISNENIQIGKRIRDIIGLKDGRIVLLTDPEDLKDNTQIMIIEKLDD